MDIRQNVVWSNETMSVSYSQSIRAVASRRAERVLPVNFMSEAQGFIERRSQRKTSNLPISIQSKDHSERSCEKNRSIFPALVLQCESDW